MPGAAGGGAGAAAGAAAGERLAVPTRRRRAVTTQDHKSCAVVHSRLDAIM